MNVSFSSLALGLVLFLECYVGSAAIGATQPWAGGWGGWAIVLLVPVWWRCEGRGRGGMVGERGERRTNPPPLSPSLPLSVDRQGWDSDVWQAGCSLFQHLLFCLPMIGWSRVIHTEKWVRWPVENRVCMDRRTVQTCPCTYLHMHPTQSRFILGSGAVVADK